MEIAEQKEQEGPMAHSLRVQVRMELERRIDEVKRDPKTRFRAPFHIRHRLRSHVEYESYVVDKRGHRVGAVKPISYSAEVP